MESRVKPENLAFDTQFRLPFQMSSKHARQLQRMEKDHATQAQLLVDEIREYVAGQESADEARNRALENETLNNGTGGDRGVVFELESEIASDR